MDIYLTAVQSHLKLARKTLQARLKVVEKQSTGMLYREWTLAHTSAMLSYVEELEGMVIQDPENWDDEPDLAPF